jgi:sugar/nucleoside kinase (ribokinase family)
MEKILKLLQGGVFMKIIATMALNPAIDKSSSVAHVVAEQKLYCKPPRFEPGGGGVNVSRAIKKLGGESMLLYAAGGLTGERLKALLDQEGLDHRPFPIEGLMRESLVILEESTGRQYRFGMPGPEFQKKEWEQFLDAGESCHFGGIHRPAVSFWNAGAGVSEKRMGTIPGCIIGRRAGARLPGGQR